MKVFSVDFVCDALKEQRLLDDAQVQQIKIQEQEQRERLRKKAGHESGQQLTAVDVISSMNLYAASNSNQLLSEELIMKSLAAHWKLPFLKIDHSKTRPCAETSKLSEPFVRKHLAIPVSASERMLFVAMVNPMNFEALEAIQRVSPLQIRPVVSTKTDIVKAIDQCYRLAKTQNNTEQMNALNRSVAAAEKETEPDDELRELSDTSIITSRHADKHIVNVVNLLLNYAFEQRTSEIHIEPKRHQSVVRFRIDGILYDVKQLPLEIHTSIVQRLKALANMNISERRRPQDGRAGFGFHDRNIHLRISAMPVTFGEKLVLRLFDPITLFRPIDDLGFSAEELQQVLSFVSRSSGIILITGPAVSGKTTTMYSMLNHLAERGINITTLEDPVESEHEGFNQIEVQPQFGLTFEVAMRHLVRQSPDVIMVGEMRDKESVEYTMQAALTGHLILTTLHTYDAPSALVRLVNLGTQPALVESTVIAVIAQRLIRRVCEQCAKPYRLSPQELAALNISPEQAESWSLRKGAGCVACRGTGYRGQSAIFEILEMTDNIGALLRKGAGAQAITRAVVKRGMHTLKDNALTRMIEGITTPEEVLRLTGGLKEGVPHQFKSTIVLQQAQ